MPLSAQEENYFEREFEKLLALEGTWKMKTKKGILTEIWKRKSSKALEGISYRINGTDSLLLERLELRYNRSGIYYVPTTENQNNQQPVVFTLRSSINEVFIFENPEHDFPKRIVYHLVNPDSIHAYIDDGGNLHRSNYYFKKQ